MKVYLVQHAEAKSEEEDPERPLTDKGRDEVSRIAAHMAGRPGLNISVIYHSGKTRARQTAEILADSIKPRNGVRETDGLDPKDDPMVWAERIRTTKNDVMLVGHLPHLELLAARLICGDDCKRPVHFRNAAVVCLQRSEYGSWGVEWMMTPTMV